MTYNDFKVGDTILNYYGENYTVIDKKLKEEVTAKDFLFSEVEHFTVDNNFLILRIETNSEKESREFNSFLEKGAI
jgi:hypothetical protein